MLKEIRKEFHFAVYTIYKNIQSQMELKFSFWFGILGMALNNASFVVVWVSFGVIAGKMGGWQATDYLLSVGVLAFADGLFFVCFGGFRTMPDLARNGELDKFLLSPKNFILRVGTSKLYTEGLGDMFFGLVSIIAWVFLTGSFGLYVYLNILFFITVAFFIFFFFMIFTYSCVFWFQNSNSIIDGLFELLLTPALFYGGAFTGWVKKFFIYIIPSFLLGNIAIEVIKNPTWQMYVIVSSITLFWIVFALYIFRISVRRYESSNFINFG
jgi:ABC-2 type transport system permease protein